MKYLFTFSIVVGMMACVHAADWPQFRGPKGQSVADDAKLPVEFSATEGQRWTANLPGRGVSSPVVIGNRVYLTAASGADGDRLHVLCYQLADGKLLWQRQMWATGSTFCHPDTNMAAPTPVADKTGVYALFASGDVVAYDPDGNLKWYRSLVSDYPEISNNVGMASSPVLYQDTLILPMDNAGDSFLAAVDTRYGKNIWKVKRPREINWVSPVVRTVGDTTELLFQSDSELTAYNIKSGDVMWTYKTEGLSTIPSPFLVEKRLYIPASGLIALEITEKEPTKVWTSPTLRTGMSSPFYYKGYLYGVNGAGVLMSADAADGKIKEQQRLKGKFSSSPVAGDGKIYAANEDGTVFVVKAGESLEILAENKLGGRIQATPAIADGCLLIRTDEKLYCISGK